MFSSLSWAVRSQPFMCSKDNASEGVYWSSRELTLSSWEDKETNKPEIGRGDNSVVSQTVSSAEVHTDFFLSQTKSLASNSSRKQSTSVRWGKAGCVERAGFLQYTAPWVCALPWTPDWAQSPATLAGNVRREGKRKLALPDHRQTIDSRQSYAESLFHAQQQLLCLLSEPRATKKFRQHHVKGIWTPTKLAPDSWVAIPREPIKRLPWTLDLQTYELMAFLGLQRLCFIVLMEVCAHIFR